MPHRRRVHKGSFGGHFDELVKHFRNHDQEPQENAGAKAPDKRKESGSVHDRLFETAWRKGRGH